MSITLRNTSDTTTSQTYDYASKTTPLTSTEVDKNFITLKQKCDELATDYTTTFNADGSLKDGAVTSVSITDNSVTATKIKDRSVDWAEQRNVIYLTDTSTTANKVEGTINNYSANSSLTALPANTIIYFKAANKNTASVTLTIKDLNTSTSNTSTLLSLDLTKQKDVPLGADDIKAGGIYVAFYDGTTIQLVNTLQDPTVEVKESISRVQTFGPLEWDVSALPTTGDLFDARETNLSEHPTTITAMLKCIGGDDAYADGDLVPIALATDKSGDVAFTVIAQQTEIKVARSNETADSDALKLPKDGGTQSLNPVKWKVVVRGTYQNDSTYSPAYVDRDLSYPAAYPCGGVTTGNYLYIFSSQSRNNPASNPIYKINLVTNKVIYIGTTYGYQNPATIQHSDSNSFHAANVSINDAGSNYKVGDIVTIAGSSGTSEGGTFSAAAKFVVKKIVNNAAPGPVETMYSVDDSEGVGQLSGTYTVPPTNPVGTTGGNGTGLKLIVNWTTAAVARTYWTDYDGGLHYIEPNNSDYPESVTKVEATGTFDGASYIFNVQAFESSKYYGFDLAKSPATFKTIHLYDISSAVAFNTSALNLFDTYDAVRNLEGNVDKELECLQWNPIKKRLYVSARRSNLMHIFTWGSGSLTSLFGLGSNPTYEKTIGIPAAGESDRLTIDTVHVDWDIDTGEEKSITVTRYQENGSVTRAAWKED